MKVILFGATGMVGRGVLQECLESSEVERVLAVGRQATGLQHPKLAELQHKDFLNFTPVEDQLSGYDACFFCLGISSVGMNEADYHRVTYEYAMAAAQTLVRKNPGMTFIFVSGRSTDSTEQGSAMWARVKGKTENALLKLPFKAAYMFRPGYIHATHGVPSKTLMYRVLYSVVGPLYPVWKTLFPHVVTTTQKVGRAMIIAASKGAPKRILESDDINACADSR